MNLNLRIFGDSTFPDVHEYTPPRYKKSSEQLKKKRSFGQFLSISGGTGLALQIGHRESEDLDFFSQKDFNSELLQKEFANISHLENVQIDKGTLNCFVDNVQIQFLHYPYKLLEEKIDWEGIAVSSVLDIACTKLLTISSRVNRKDFIDLYFILQIYPLSFLFKKLGEKYTNINYDKLHILKSLIYFEEADSQPSQRMHKAVNWETIKKEIKKVDKDFKL